MPALVSLAAFAIACDATEPRGPGSISVSSVAQSQDDFFEYGITIDGGTPRRAFVGQTVVFTQGGLAHGAHTVAIVDAPPACTGTGTRNVTLRGDDTVAVIFTINCPRTTGDMRVNVTTTGVDFDPNGYLMTFNSQIVTELPTNGSVTFNFIEPGTYTVGLADVAANCTATPQQSVTISSGQLSTVSFTVTCTAVGILRFVNSITGADRDPDGALVTVDGVSSRVTFGGTTNVRVPAGTRSYSVSDVQPNCTVTGPTTGTHTLAGGDTVTVTLAADCSAIPAGTAGTTTITEAAGDTLPNPSNGPGAYDIIGMNARYTPGFMILAIRFQKAVQSPATGLASALYGYLEFDIDESGSTGKPAFVNSFGGNSSQGVDYFLDFFLTDTASTQLVRTPTPSQPFFSGGRVRVRYEGDSLVVIVPLNKLANDDGRMTVTMVLGTGDRPTDIAQNVGEARVQPPAPLLALRGDAQTRVVLDPTPIAPAPTAGKWRRNR